MGHRGVIRVFPVWPKDRDATFVKIRCWGAFLVSGELKDGVVQPIEIISEKGRDCTVVNPWPGESVEICRDETGGERIEGDRFTIHTEPGERILLRTVREGA